MKNISLLLILLAIIVISCNNENKSIKPQRTIISGQVRNLDSTDNKVITVIYTDPFFKARMANRLEESGVFHTASNMCFTQNMTINLNNKFINILVNPSDSLFLDIDMNLFRKGNFEGITISGNSPNIDFNNKFNPFYNYISGYFNSDFNNDLPVDEYLNQFRIIIDDSYKKIDQYALENNIDKEIVNWVKKDLIYGYSNYILDYSNDNIEQKLQVLTNSIFDIDNHENFSTMMFPYHLSAVANSIVGADSSFMSFVKGRDIKGLCVRGVELLMKRPASICRDYMLYDFVKGLFEKDPQLKLLVSEECFTDPFFSEQLGLSKNAESKQYADISAEGIVYLDSRMQANKIDETNFMKYLAEKYKDKVLYIDVWATWCGPCIAQMKPAKEIKRLYVDKDVVFVYLCLGSEVDKWIPTIDKNDIKGEHYFFDSDASQLFLSTYQLPGYPCYLLMDKKGEIISIHAPRPSNTNAVTEAIDRVLL